MFREFRIGNGKIIQGDCLEVLKTLSDNEIVLAFTSPPYLNATRTGKTSSKLPEKSPRREHYPEHYTY
jgi:DNA modification methylase